jgi:hypothetical protein
MKDPILRARPPATPVISLWPGSETPASASANLEVVFRQLLNFRGRQAVFVFLALLALASGGCLVVAAGAGAGAAVAGYAYVKGKVCYSFNASLEDTWAATRKALAELQMPVQSEERESASTGFIKSQTSDGTAVRIYLEVQPSPFPTEGPHTRVCIRVGAFGDYAISDRIMGQLNAHLVPVTVGNGPGSPPGQPPVPPGTPRTAGATTPASSWSAVEPPTTAPPPLLPPEPVK